MRFVSVTFLACLPTVSRRWRSQIKTPAHKKMPMMPSPSFVTSNPSTSNSPCQKQPYSQAHKEVINGVLRVHKEAIKRSSWRHSFRQQRSEPDRQYLKPSS